MIEEVIRPRIGGIRYQDENLVPIMFDETAELIDKKIHTPNGTPWGKTPYFSRSSRIAFMKKYTPNDQENLFFYLEINQVIHENKTSMISREKKSFYEFMCGRDFLGEFSHFKKCRIVGLSEDTLHSGFTINETTLTGRTWNRRNLHVKYSSWIDHCGFWMVKPLLCDSAGRLHSSGLKPCAVTIHGDEIYAYNGRYLGYLNMGSEEDKEVNPVFEHLSKFPEDAAFHLNDKIELIRSVASAVLEGLR